jgi:hypothetical protein
MKKLPKLVPDSILLSPGGLTRPGAYTAFDLVGVRIGMHDSSWMNALQPQPETVDHRHVIVAVLVCTEDNAYRGHRRVLRLVVNALPMHLQDALKQCVSEWQTALQQAKGKGIPCFVACASKYDVMVDPWWMCLVPGDVRPAAPESTVITDATPAFLGELS